MSTIRLKYQCVQTMVENPNIGLIVLTDEDETRQISIVCDGFTRLQLAVRTSQIDPSQIRFQSDMEGDEDHFPATEDEESQEEPASSNPAKKDPLRDGMLPETLCSIIHYMTNLKLAVNIFNVYDGEYRAAIVDQTSGTRFPVRVTEGILLALVNKHVPLTIEDIVWKHQSTPYKSDGKGVAIPINTLTLPMLKNALQNAIDEERYEAAKALKEEIERRKGA